MRSWRPFCCGWPGLMRSMAMPSLRHTESFERLNNALGLAKGTPLADGKRQAALAELPLKGDCCRLLAREIERFARKPDKN